MGDVRCNPTLQGHICTAQEGSIWGHFSPHTVGRPSLSWWVSDCFEKKTRDYLCQCAACIMGSLHMEASPTCTGLLIFTSLSSGCCSDRISSGYETWSGGPHESVLDLRCHGDRCGGQSLFGALRQLGWHLRLLVGKRWEQNKQLDSVTLRRRHRNLTNKQTSSAAELLIK